MEVMSSENKYYTPEIKEFHVGFEYEFIRVKDGEIYWEKDIFGELYHKSRASLDITLKKGARVKYLNREDIESLDYKHFKHHPKGAFSAVDYYSGYSAGLTHYHDTNTIVIYEQLQGDVEGETWFRGTIKNKSELKKILKQIGV